MRKIIAITGMICAVSIPTANAYAMDYIKNLLNRGKEKAAEVLPITPENQFKPEFDQEAKLVTKTYFEENPVTFELKIPESWEFLTQNQPTPTAVDTRLLKTMDTYRGPIIVGGDRPILKIQSIQLEHEILAEHWLQDYIFQNGYTQEGDLDSASETESLIQFIHLQNGVSYKAYMKAYIVGNRVLSVRYDSPVVAGEKFYEYGQYIIESFEIKEYQSNMIEEMKDFSFQNNIKFSYPASWKLENSAMKNPNRKSFELQNLKGEEDLKGLIKFVSLRKNENDSVENFVSAINNSIRTSHGLRIVDLIGSAPLSIGLSFDTAIVEKYEAGLDGTSFNNYELWMAVLESEEWVNFIYLLTPKSSVDYYNWARNTRTYDLILHSIN